MSRKEYEEMTTGAGPPPEAVPKASPRKVSHVLGAEMMMCLLGIELEYAIDYYTYIHTYIHT